MSGRRLDALVGDCEVAQLFTDSAELEGILRFEVALAEAQADAGFFPREAAERIAIVCQSFKPDAAALAAGMATDGVVIPALIKSLRAAVGPPHADAVHLGATSQDAIDTSLMLRLTTLFPILDGRLGRLVATLDELKATSSAIPLMARTRMQDALPFTVGDKIETWSASLVRDRRRLAELRPRLLVVQLGGPVGDRRGLRDRGDQIAAGVAARLSLGDAPAWHSERDRIGEFGAFLSLVSGSLGKIGQDVALMAQNERHEIRLAAGGGSSAMPHKSNPVAAEALVALARYNAGLLGTLHQALIHENERSGAAWTLEWLTLPDMAIAAGASTRLAQGLLDGLSFVRRRGDRS